MTKSVAKTACCCGGSRGYRLRRDLFECGCDGMVGQVVLQIAASLPVILFDDCRQIRHGYENARQTAFSQHAFLHSARLLSASTKPSSYMTAPVPRAPVPTFVNCAGTVVLVNVAAMPAAFWNSVTSWQHAPAPTHSSNVYEVVPSSMADASYNFAVGATCRFPGVDAKSLTTVPE